MSQTKALLTAVNNYICKFNLTPIELPIFDHLSAIKLIDYNLDSGTYSVDVDNDVINIKVSDYVDGVFSNILDIDGFHIVSEYDGYIENNKKVIEKVK